MIGIIGGSGLYDIEGFTDQKEVAVSTPFGDPSDPLVVGNLAGRKVAFLARHGKGHRLTPTEINFRANIYAMKAVGVTRILSVSAVGSMKEHLVPGHMVVVDQFYDNTKHRVSTFFGEGAVGHVALAHPICAELAATFVKGARAAGATVHAGGTYICIEGPQFSTLAESRIYRAWGVDVIGMTNVTEAKLAREAGLCYATLAMVTDYDCWHPEHDAVTTEAVIAVLLQNVATSKAVIRATLAGMPEKPACRCAEAAKNAIISARDNIPAATREKLRTLVGGALD
ncbi:MAG: S-methyl-5'-thioadenosine phosphorylase [Nitrospirae bacterium]|nr:S-methyl-5'-thioadenosine phosphorylase [Nitrospirota bacterium]